MGAPLIPKNLTGQQLAWLRMRSVEVEPGVERDLVLVDEASGEVIQAADDDEDGGLEEE